MESNKKLLTIETEDKKTIESPKQEIEDLKKELVQKTQAFEALCEDYESEIQEKS